MIHLSYTISECRKYLIIKANEAARAELAELPARFDHGLESDAAMYDAFEWLVCNSELAWISPQETGDLTDAPMLGIYGVGPDDKDAPVSERWAYLLYMTRSPLQDLLENGRAVFHAP